MRKLYYLSSRDNVREDPFILHKNSVDKQMNSVHHLNSKAEVFYNRINHFMEKFDTDRKVYPHTTDRSVFLDVYGWILLFHGYDLLPKDGDKFCKDIFNEEMENLHIVEKDKFNYFVKILYVMFDFELESFYDVYMYQGDIISILKQVVQGSFFLGNRFNRERKILFKSKYMLDIFPNKYDKLPLPMLNQMCDGLKFPINICKNTNEINMQRLDVDLFGDGDFVCMGDEVIDCIRINDYWLIDKPLKQRLKFTYGPSNEEAAMLTCYSLSDVKKYSPLLNFNPDDGLLIRSLGDNFYRNYWFVLNSHSYFLSHIDSHDNPTLSKTKRASFFTLEGRPLGAMGYDREDAGKLVWLDEEDVEKFIDILKI